jgi:uncharacterized protein YdiU (UPF0061 family)
MRAEPQAGDYRPDPQILSLAPWLADPVEAARFPAHTLRFRNQRWAEAVGLAGLTEAEWAGHFGAFTPLPANLPGPLALRYHGHQFQVYNPEIGDGRGFLFAQLRDAGGDQNGGRLLDLGTKGSGQTPWSRFGDGRLTLKGAVREIMATEMLEALGVYTSKTFSVIETGERLYRNDEPSPTRSAVLVRLSHGHVRIGSFQRLLALEEKDHMAALTDYCLAQFPQGEPPADAPGRAEPAVRLMHQVVERLADLAASYIVAGFVHGVLNTDNMNVTGESFDYGPWRWLPQFDLGFTAAYFDHQGLYAYGRQPQAIYWNCGQMAQALSLLADTGPLVFALERFPALYRAAVARRFCWRLGVEPRGLQADLALVAAADRHMTDAGISPDAFHHAHRAGRNPPEGPLGDLLRGYVLAAGSAGADGGIWDEAEPVTNHIDEVERIWTAIADHDDWSALTRHVVAIRELGAAMGDPPVPPVMAGD